MNCPICQTSVLAPYQLNPQLTSQKCGQCGGQWISSFEFWKWLQTDHARQPAAAPTPTLSASDSGAAAARICPECGHILGKYRVGHSLNFSLERCGNCGGTWFDRNEWEILESGELRDKIHLIFSAAWQQQVRTEDRARHLQKLFVEKIGQKDFAEIRRVREWLSQHPYRRELRAYLDSDEF